MAVGIAQKTARATRGLVSEGAEARARPPQERSARARDEWPATDPRFGWCTFEIDVCSRWRGAGKTDSVLVSLHCGVKPVNAIQGWKVVHLVAAPESCKHCNAPEQLAALLASECAADLSQIWGSLGGAPGARSPPSLLQQRAGNSTWPHL